MGLCNFFQRLFKMKIKLLFLAAVAVVTTTLCLAAAKPHTPPAPVAQATPSPTSTPLATPEPQPSAAVVQSVSGTNKPTYNSCKVEEPYIAMTFDDGPSAKLTPRLLDMLKERGIKATFFLIGQNVAANPEIVQRIVAEGHEVANHSWDHKAFTKVGADGVKMEITETNDAIQKAVGFKPVLVRPPYGATNSSITKRLNEEYGLKVIMWSVDPLDWKDRNSSIVKDRILKGAGPGSIILAHDIHVTTVDAMPATLDALIAKGYKFATVSELIKMDKELPPAQAASSSAQPQPAATPYMR